MWCRFSRIERMCVRSSPCHGECHDTKSPHMADRTTVVDHTHKEPS